MTRGGKRTGAGRKVAEPTKQVRLPARGAGVARPLVDYFLKMAEEIWDDNFGEKARREGFNPIVKLNGLKIRECSSLLGTKGSTEVIEATAEMGGLRSTFSFRLDGSNFEYETEEEI